MQSTHADYFAAYRNLKLARDSKGLFWTTSISSWGPGTRMTRYVCRLFRSPRPSSPLGA